VALLATVTVPLALPAAVGAKSTLSAADWPGVRMRPELTPLGVNAALEELTPEIVMFEVPLLVRVTLRDLLLPVLTLPKLKLVGFAPSTWVAARPVPLRAIAVGEPGALLVSEMLPEALPEEVGAKTALNVALLPAETVWGEKPVILNPAPVALPCEIVRFALPVFFRVIVCELLLPVTTLPKATLDGVTVSCGCAPVPLRTIAVGEPGALLVSEMLPEALPEEVGVKTALNVALLPGEIVWAEKPVTLNPLPATLSCETVRLALPVFVRVTVCELLLPTATAPKLTLDGATVSCGCVPVPLRAMVVGEPDAFVASEMLPEALPEEVGVKTALNVVLLPGEIVWAEKPVTLNPLPATLSCETVRFALPVFVRVTVCELLPPTLTLPKLTLDGVSVNCGCVPVPLKETVTESEASPVTVRLPVTAPADCGAN